MLEPKYKNLVPLSLEREIQRQIVNTERELSMGLAPASIMRQPCKSQKF